MAAGYGIAVKAIAGGINGFLQGDQSNALRNQIIGAYSHLPQAPNLNKQFMAGWNAELGATPQAVAEDESLRSQVIPNEMSQAAAMYGAYAPQIARTNLATLKSVDPQFLADYGQLSNSLGSQLAAGSGLTPEMTTELQGQIRGAQAARGNVLGDAPVSGEALYLGQAGQQLLQQRQGAMESFLNGANPESQFNSLAGAGGTALAAGSQDALMPGYMFQQGPQNWAQAYAGNAQTQWQDTDTNALAQARAIASAPAAVNPWLASLQGSFGAVSGGGGSGGSRSSSSGLGSLMSLFGGSSGGSGGSYSGYAPGGGSGN